MSKHRVPRAPRRAQGPSNWREWVAAQRETLTLPSGLIATVRRVSVADLAIAGQVPVPLLGKIQQAESVAADTSDIAALEDFQKNPELMEMVTIVARAAMVEPPIGDVTDDQHLGIDDFTAQDRIAVFNWANQEAAAMLPFPAPSEPGGGIVGAGGALRPDAEPAPGIGPVDG